MTDQVAERQVIHCPQCGAVLAEEHAGYFRFHQDGRKIITALVLSIECGRRLAPHYRERCRGIWRPDQVAISDPFLRREVRGA